MHPFFIASAGNTTDPTEHWSFVATIAGVIFTIIWAISQWREETKVRRDDRAKELERRKEDLEKEQKTRSEELTQRQQELRWKQAKLARKMMDAIFDFDPSNDAWRMVDDETEYKSGEKEYAITMTDVRDALKVPWGKDEDIGEPKVYIRRCFDALFYYLEQIEHAIQLNILRFEDVQTPAEYYVAKMATDKPLFENYAEFIRFRRANAFLKRFDEWGVDATPASY